VMTAAACSGGSKGSGGSTGEAQESIIDGGAGESATELSYWTFVELHGQHFEKMLTKWNAENTDRQIKLNVSVMPYDDMHNKLSIALQTGVGAPDLADIERGKVHPVLSGTPQLEPLNDSNNPYRNTLEQTLVDLYSNVGQKYSTPTHDGASVAFYNVEVLEK